MNDDEYSPSVFQINKSCVSVGLQSNKSSSWKKDVCLTDHTNWLWSQGSKAHYLLEGHANITMLIWFLFTYLCVNLYSVLVFLRLTSGWFQQIDWHYCMLCTAFSHFCQSEGRVFGSLKVWTVKHESVKETEMISCFWGIRGIAGAFCQTHTFVQVWLDWHGRDSKGERVAPYLFPGGVVLCRVCSDWAVCSSVCVFLCVCLSMLNPKTADSTLRSQGPLKLTELNHCSPPTHTALYFLSASQSFSSIDRSKGSKERKMVNSLIFINILAQNPFEQTSIDKNETSLYVLPTYNILRLCGLLKWMCYYFSVPSRYGQNRHYT